MKKMLFILPFLLVFFGLQANAQWSPANFWKQVGNSIQLWNSNLSLGSVESPIKEIYTDLLRSELVEISGSVVDGSLYVGTSTNNFSSNLVLKNIGGTGVFSLDTSGNLNFSNENYSDLFRIGDDGNITIGNNSSDITISGKKLIKNLDDLKLASNPEKGGLLRNIDKATGDVAITTSGWIEDEKYSLRAILFASCSAEFDTAVTRTGSKTLKLSTTDVSGRGMVSISLLDANASVDYSINDTKKYGIKIKPSTKYKVSVYAKTNNVASNGVYISTRQINSQGVRLTEINSAKLTGTNDWTLLEVSFTSNVSADYFTMNMLSNVAGNISDAWFDINSMILEEVVEDTTFTGGVAEKVRPVIQAITSVDNIDQSLDDTGAYTNTYALTNAVNEGATHLQTFTPTKKYITKIGVWVVAKGTGNWTLYIHDSANNIRSRETIANADLVEGAFNYFEVPTLWTTGNYHFHLFSSVADGTVKANTSNDLETASYIQQYAKKSEGATVVLNGVKTELKADNDGLLSNSIIDLDNGKYFFRSVSDVRAGVGERVANLYSSTVNDPATIGTVGRYGLTNGTNSILKINTILPIKTMTFSAIGDIGAGETLTMAYSEDLVNWKDIDTFTGATATLRATINNLKGNIIYLRFSASGGTIYVTTVTVQADLDTSSIPQGLVYPISENKFVETIKTPASANRIYYYKNKYQNEFGVVTPALEYTQGGTFLGFTPLKIDNSQETNPAVAIVKAETTNGRNSGTGSDSGDNYILNDGEYMSLSASADELSISYLVGQGTTAFGNITKNVFYLSSNAESVDSTQDPSHQANIVLGVREQGLVDRVKDLGEMAQDVRSGLNNTKQTLKNNVLTTGFDAGTTDSYSITLPEFFGYTTGMTAIFRANTANTGASTLSINNYPAKTIVKAVNTTLANNDILAGMYCYVVFDGTNFVLLNPRAL